MAKAKPKPKPRPKKAPPKPRSSTKARPKPSPTTKARAKPSKAPRASRDDPDADLSVSGQVYQRGKLVPSVLHIDTRSGKIVRIAKSTTLATHIDLGNKAILPGGIDIHVHFREPGHTHKEDILSGSTAAAFGGITAYADMPNTLPATISARALREKLAIMAQKSVVDYGAWAGGSWYTGDLPEMLKYAVGVKTYLGATTGDLLLEDQGKFQAVLAAAGHAARPAVLHAEANRVLAHLRRSEAGLEDHDTLRPPLAEVEAIYDAMKAMAGIKRPPTVHIAHIASPDAVQAATTAKFSTGVCPHHLLLDTGAPLTHAYGKMNPPLRSPTMRKALWDLFAKGKIPILESDHAPHTSVEKEDNFHAAPSGVPGVETMIPVLLAQVKAGKIPLDIVVDAATKNPAALLGLTDRGTLEAGMKADFAAYDLKAPTKVDSAHLHSKCGWSPFDGHTAIFPTHTYLAGRPVIEDGDLVAAPGSGKSLRPLPKE
ncbi:MAG: dihydroorotase [bacterium]